MWFRQSSSLLILLYCMPCTEALLGRISAPGLLVDFTKALDQPVSKQIVSSVVESPVSFRVRSTRQRDIENIASLLASTSGTGEGWSASLDRLRRASSFQSLLSLRHETLREGRKAISKVWSIVPDEVSPADRLRLVWQHESFRNRIQKAADLSTEPHIWKEHNFALCPADISHLQHLMLTAECTNTGKVIGFCEVGMMSSPDEDTVIAPTIANLVTCPNHRRRGIAKSLLSSATRYVQQCWKEDQLALYVSHGNREALSLYKKYGFQPQSNLEQNQHNDMNDNKCYMTKRIQSQAPVMEWAS